MPGKGKYRNDIASKGLCIKALAQRQKKYFKYLIFYLV